jgi:predicted DNA-binding protein with PD1-like motif
MITMRVHTVSGQQQKTHVVVLEPGEEVTPALMAVAEREQLRSAHFTAIGAFSDIVLGFYDREEKSYREIPIREQVEVLVLTGTFAEEHGEPRIHAHVVVGKRDGSAHGGHLLRGIVFPTLEIVIVEVAGTLVRKMDPQTGLALIDGAVAARTRK